MSGYAGKIVLSTKLDTSGLKNADRSIKSALASSTKAVAAFGAAVATAIGTVVKKSVDAYADFEQLTGGVETLFKTSADKVKKYADEAYRTAGISGNTYMETVTSFSASLISSLKGDTEKAADVANMAIIDMSDNANKMGSTFESIQTAYQGFAKQNYTLLDNLKLGYGGTKTEMERLLKDAEAFSGVKYDINNLADVYEAIHQIQTKLDITGTTAKEAATTIAGSGNMAKAAWQNVLTAIAGGGDLDKAIDNFVDSFSKYFDNIEPAVERSLIGVGQLVEKIGPKLIQTISSALIKAIPDLLNAVYKMILGLAQGIAQGIKALFSETSLEVLEKQADIIAESAKNQESLKKEVEETGDAAKKAVTGFDELNVLGTGESESKVSMPSEFTSGTIDVSTKIQDNISPQIQIIADKIKNLIEPLQNIDFNPAMESFKNLGGSIKTFGGAVLNALEWVWFDILVPLAEWRIEEFAPATVDALSDAFGSLSVAVESVKQPIEDFWNNTLQPIFQKIGYWIIEIVNQTKDSFGYMSEKLVEYKDEIAMVIEGIGAVLQIIWSVIGPIIESVISGIGSKLKTAIDFIFSLVQVLGNAFGFIKNIFLAIVNVFKGNFEEAGKYAKQALTNFVNIFVGIANSIISVINNLWSLIFDAFKGTVNSIGGLVSKIGSWIGFDWDLHWDAKAPLIPTIPKIPALAKGAVIPPNREFMAVLGDQKHGTNIEAPLDTIKQALAEVLAMQDGGGETNVNVTFTGDLAQLARVLKPAIETETRRRGGSLVKGAVY